MSGWIAQGVLLGRWLVLVDYGCPMIIHMLIVTRSLRCLTVRHWAKNGMR